MSFPQATPMRPVPGAFLNTPAVVSRYQSGGASSDPTRRQLFPPSAPSEQLGGTPVASSAAASGPNPITSVAMTATGGAVASTAVTPIAPPRAETVAPVIKAARAVNQCLQSDENFPDLDSYIRQGVSADYELSSPDAASAPFHKTNMFPIPNQVFDHYNSGKLQTLMGLFAEISHAWVVIDNSIFLWDYTLSDPELIGFEDQPHTIHAVALVPPKPGIFVDSINYILALATSADMILLGVSVTTTPAGTRSVALYQTKMTLPLRGTDVRIIAGSADGRIFFGGSNEVDVNELYYQSEEKWFSNRCGRINHTNPGWSSIMTLQSSFWVNKAPEHLVDIVIDDSRNLIYTLSSASTIRTYHMEPPSGLKNVIVKEKISCVRDITHMTDDAKLLSSRMEIVSISPIAKQEASKLHLMALTNTGCRLFLSATNASAFYSSSSNLAPQSMQVQFIKFPTQDVARRLAMAGSELQTLKPSRQGYRFPPGYFLDFVSNGVDNTDSLFLAAPETGRIKSVSALSTVKYPESANWIDIGSRAEAVGLTTKPFSAAAQPVGFGNELAVQFDEDPTEFAVLTNTGVHVIRRRRFVDIFASTIRSVVGDEGFDQVARRLIQAYGRVETVSAALAVACGHGGDSRPGAPRAIDQITEDRARGVFVDYGGQPTITETDGTVLTTDSVKLSSRHDALVLYLARLVRTLWRAPVVELGPAPTGGIAVSSSIPLPKLGEVQEYVERLRRFLHANRGLIQGLSGPSDLQRASSRQEEVALQAEHQALHALQTLMESISEGISFVLMLFDERVADIYTRLDGPAQEQFKVLTYAELFADSDGKELAKLVVKAIVNRNIESGSNVETVADALRRRCGSFCSPDDVVIFKAQEQLKRASEQPPNTSQSRALLAESLRLFEKVAGSLSPANLQSAVAQFVELKYYAGAIRLCLVVAHEKDRGNTALSWVNDGRPASDPRAAAYNERKRCYDMVHEALSHVDAAAAREPELVDGKLTLMATKRLEAYGVVNNSDDQVFHFDLYAWYVSQGWTDRILAIDSPHVVTFLKRLASTDVQHADLLCRFYTNRSRFFDAAEVQVQLATSDFPLGIKDRIRLLSLAKANANVSTVGVSRQQQQLLNHEVSELLEIANIQDDLLERLHADVRFDEERRVQVTRDLDGKIEDLSTLFNSYADQAGYYDLCLLIYHAADYRTSTTIAGTWTNLIHQVHDEVLQSRESADPTSLSTTPMPYEAVSSKIQTIAHHLSLDSFVFPIPTLLPELCRYAVAEGQDRSIGADPCWPVRLFLTLGVSHDMVVRVLEGVFETEDWGFRGATRSRVIELIVFAVGDWVADVRRRGGTGKGGAIGPAVGELLQKCETELPAPGRGQNPGGADLADIRAALRSLRREVAGLVERLPVGSMRFM
ncbi:nuclear pore complex protein Nup155 [Geosmithia morbida]|uniref:Nuclear pore complex protein Nup155 n=1 Tax=Geosmithia morbida TaxID=1094350 RepID=A0A9P5D0S6_9HYPO|nr:nuclear pore complex protein Nup155 [Geosmithia morbida]KAF4123048.1 nuclear pore complex protein Nup155 [Geosmithia morbida]